ncbi:MAG: hypothetical protein WBS24_12615 [Terriglobales bacterium]
MKTALAAIGTVVVLMALIALIAMIITNRDKELAAGNADDKLAVLPRIVAKQADDLDQVRGQYTDEYLHIYTSNMVDVQYGLGQPNRTLKFTDDSCNLPALVAVYNDLHYEGAFALEYRNLHCQPDQRAYSLVGIHPLPGQWSRKVGMR